jgi:anti-anti-sigma factor
LPASQLDSGGTVELSRESEHIVVLALQGEFDMANASKLAEQIDQALYTDHVIIELGAATFIDSSILSVLVHTAGVAERRGRAAVVQLATGDPVEHVVRLTDIDRFVPCVPTRAQATKLILQHTVTDSGRGSP